MYEDLAATIQCIVNEPIRDSEVLFRVLTRLIIEMDVKVLKVVFALGVRLASHIQNVCDACVDELARLEGTLERAHVNTVEDFYEADIINVVVAAAEVEMRETGADDLLLFPSVVLTVIH